MTARAGTPLPPGRTGTPAAAPSRAGAAGQAHPPARSPGDQGPVVVARNRRFEGLLTFRGRAQIEGEVRGQVFCRGTLRLGPDSLVTGVIDADELIVSGRLQGEATARQRIELSPSARVEGVIRAPRLLLADGCQLEGRCEMLPATEHDAESALPEPRLPEPRLPEPRLPEPRETGAKRSEG